VVDFANAFQALTGNPPFPWQRALYERFAADRPDNIPASCNLPTGLGKTSIIAVWLIALANGAAVPRRLVYVVNRRTVVDQTTDEVEKYRDRLADCPELLERLLDINCPPVTVPYRYQPLAVSTLRGQFADNREWSADPSRPAVICGTVDMIGSRLLFSGYGVGMKGKPLHAGFLGQDALLVHDEAHLEPAFQTLIETIRDEQQRCKDFNPLRVMELTATPRSGGEVFELTPEEKKAPDPLPPRPKTEEEKEKTPPVHHVWWRTHSKKALALHEIGDEKKELVPTVAKLALRYKDDEAKPAVLVFVRTVESVNDVVKELKKGKVSDDSVLTLTGTMRGYERDRMATESKVFARFKKHTPVEERTGTVYLVCTSAGEVGVDMSADHMVCDLSTYDSMAQRFGRVNRYGFGDATIDVVHPAKFETKDKPFEVARERTLGLLKRLRPRSEKLLDASPAALGELLERAIRESGIADRTQALREYILSAFAPTPTLLPATDILFDAWALTTVRDKLPGRPPVEPYLHGLPTDWQPPETHVAWREEVEKLQPKYATEEEREQRQQADRKTLAKFAVTLLEDFPLKPHELLQDRMTRVRAAIDALAENHPDAPAWVVDEDDEVTVTTLRELTATEKRDGKTVYKIDSRYGTILLPPSVGGLNDQGMLDPKSPTADDVSCEWFEDKERTNPRRARSDEEDPPEGMRLVRRIELPGTGGDDAETEYWYWFARGGGDDDASKSAREPIRWQHHTDDVKRNLVAIAGKLFPNDTGWQRALELAADWHDLGKKRVVWQRSIGNPCPTDWHAKSGKPKNGRAWKPSELTDYRHEFGSLLDAVKESDFQKLTDDQKELVLHLIAVHHGRGRPHFPPDEAFDPERPHDAAQTLAAEVPQRFARLQRRYGRWGLAYLESLLRAADWAASAEPSKYVEGEQ
jgi:CRISPR-associated endonuclease/helicase Cas3